jgi:hypothetical protein
MIMMNGMPAHQADEVRKDGAREDLSMGDAMSRNLEHAAQF